MRWASWSAGISCEYNLLSCSLLVPANRRCSFYEALLIPFEVSAFTLVCSFWSDKLTETGPIAGVVAGVIICYG